MLLIIGSHQDIRTGAVINELLRRSEPFVLFDFADYPYHIELAYDIATPTAGTLKTASQQKSVPLSEITAVYYCTASHFTLLPDDPPEIQHIIHNNIDAAVWGFFHGLNCRFVNPIHAANLHNYKTHLLQQLHHQGIRVPDTVVANTAEAVTHFYKKHHKKAVCKPPWGQAFTEMLTDKHMKPDMLAKLTNSPVMLQEFIPGTDMRAYVIGNHVFGVEIESKTLDLNQDDGGRRKKTELPPVVEENCRAIARIAGLPFTAIDFRRTPKGEYVYFEANSSPDFTADCGWTDYPLVERLTDLLIYGP